MISYATLGTRDLPRAKAFYDALLGEIGAQRYMDSERFVLWGVQPGKPLLGIALPYDGKPATAGNGTMIALTCKDKAEVDRLYQKALALGGSDEGPAGARSANFYAGYWRDLDGNKLAFVHVG
ncbi:VOC family protein [Stagnimonas aquatica]|uniref:VOC family protein n=1 Tax=Stagnimonas aquatica TaxID=2689987 RepID=A0A3N0V9T1_9GAMM|nr:VOC family protein [Stagnimonas aquatica]ROH89540.1 VOC family protein [Stagnimonas aquatica]